MREFLVSIMRESNRAIPLSSYSWHSRFVHRWPVAEIFRLARNSSLNRDFKAARSFMISRFRSGMLDEGIISIANSCNPMEMYTCKSTIASKLLVKPTVSRRRIVLVLPFHPVLATAGVQKVLRDFLSTWSPIISPILGQIDLQVAWRNSASPLFVLLRMASRHHS